MESKSEQRDVLIVGPAAIPRPAKRTEFGRSGRSRRSEETRGLKQLKNRLNEHLADAGYLFEMEIATYDEIDSAIRKKNWDFVVSVGVRIIEHIKQRLNTSCRIIVVRYRRPPLSVDAHKYVTSVGADVAIDCVEAAMIITEGLTRGAEVG